MAPEDISAAALAALARHVLEGSSLDDALCHVSQVAVDTLPGADEASVTLLRDGVPTTFGATSGLPVAADERQYDAGRGPCLAAAEANQPVIVIDMRTEGRWPDAASGVADEGLLSSLSVPLPLQDDVIGALNIYSRQREGFRAEHIAVAEEFAAFAAVAVANAASYASATETAHNMQAAMASRAAIEQAKGIIMGRLGCDADHAFELLAKQSQHENRKLRDVAVDLISQAQRPGRAD